MKTNYHTHTARCGHATGSDEDYVKAAIENNFSQLGFSDHSPWPNLIQPTMRMQESMLENYVASILSLREKYKDEIKIELGLECEYFKEHINWLKEIKEKHGLTYLIFGNHFESPNGIYFGNIKSKEDLLLYTKMSIEGMQSGIFSWLAHPDLFTKNYPTYDSACKESAKEICKAAKELNTPLEYNLCGYRMKKGLSNSNIHYPCDLFWEEAANQGNEVIISGDFHEPSNFFIEEDYKHAESFLKSIGISVNYLPKPFES